MRRGGRVNVGPAPPVHGHSSEEGAEDVVVLFKLVVFLIGRPMLGPRSILLRTKPVVMRLLLDINESRISVSDLLEDFLGAFMVGDIPSYWFLSGWKRSASALYAFLISASVACLLTPSIS
jgi:hypothetical protein